MGIFNYLTFLNDCYVQIFIYNNKTWIISHKVVLFLLKCRCLTFSSETLQFQLSGTSRPGKRPAPITFQIASVDLKTSLRPVLVGLFLFEAFGEDLISENDFSKFSRTVHHSCSSGIFTLRWISDTLRSSLHDSIKLIMIR